MFLWRYILFQITLIIIFLLSAKASVNNAHFIKSQKLSKFVVYNISSEISIVNRNSNFQNVLSRRDSIQHMRSSKENSWLFNMLIELKLKVTSHYRCKFCFTLKTMNDKHLVATTCHLARGRWQKWQESEKKYRGSLIGTHFLERPQKSQARWEANTMKHLWFLIQI